MFTCKHVSIGDNKSNIMMGAVINIGAKIGKNTMIDMNAILGGRAEVENSHIGADQSYLELLNQLMQLQ